VNVELSVMSLDPATTGLTILGSATLGYLGAFVSGADVNNDGFVDLIIGAPRENNYEGSTYLLICSKTIFDE